VYVGHHVDSHAQAGYLRGRGSGSRPGVGLLDETQGAIRCQRI
jgi:hypothetical protein